MVKTRAAPCATASDVRTTAKRHLPRNKKLSDAAILAVIAEPQHNLKKCVVKLRRIKLPEEATPDADSSTFEPARNSTMYVPSKVQIKKQPPVTRKKAPGLRKSPCRLIPRVNSPSKPATDVSPKKPPRFFHRDQPPARTHSSVTRNVFDFLSQSQIEDDNREDPAADIVQRLVKSGKACVMVRSTKSGKPRAKRTKNTIRPVGRRRKCTLKDLEQPPEPVPKPKELRLQKPSCALSPIYEPEEDSNDSDVYAPCPEAIEVPVQVHVEPSTSKQAQEGAYSNLARSVMLNRTQAQNPPKPTDRRRELINMARQLVSTPLNRKAPPVSAVNAATNAISPITRPSPNAVSPAGAASPWRVSDKSPMPDTFSFGFNTSQLPSYSSDHLRRRHVYVPDAQAEPAEEPAHQVSICPPLPEQGHDSNANDSNEENLPPSNASKTTTLNDRENAENAENYVHLPNPRRTLQKRAPFKEINIIEVVTLPPWKKNVQITPSKEATSKAVSTHQAAAASPAQRSQTRANLFGFDEILPCEDNASKGKETRNVTQTPLKVITPTRGSNISIATVSPANRSQTHSNLVEILPCSDVPRKSPTSRNLFGFEELITESEDPANVSAELSQNVNLHDKLHRLAELRPRDDELPRVSTNSLHGGYLGEYQSKQQDIRDVFCSTMIAPPSPPRRKKKAALPPRETMGLFRDQPEPEKTFDEKQPRRTYVKERPQRKRKKRVQVLYIESDSEDEDEQDSPNKSSPQKKQPYSKRPRRDIEHEAKLQEFITSFNKECEEVEKFQVVIE
ncbi:protein dalmatian [Drosophila biarmipes]|uniref:protein dalmatian n=1 Tax=Drosophila biarmipes TaxID=125945 RepID=UPI0007E684D0|nr:protein dalmatian [Drosophila biarmipes]